MLDIIFFSGVVLYFISMSLTFLSVVFKWEKVRKISWVLFLAGAAVSTVYLVARGIKAGRLPLSNQFEFGASFSWGIAVMLMILHYKFKADWIDTVGIAMTFLILSYAAFQPRQINELMPALRSYWFGSHIGSAAFSYASFMLAGGAGIRIIMTEKKNPEDPRLEQMDYFMYRLIAFGLLMLTITILTGAIWAEQAWSAFWTWDPKEVWALITWIIYAIFLHLRLTKKRQRTFLAWYAIVSVPVVLFTFIGVNTLMSGLHSYGMIFWKELL